MMRERREKWRGRRMMKMGGAGAENKSEVAMQAKVQGEGVPVVLVPGGLAGWLSWDPHAKRLAVTRKVVQVQLLNVQYGLENRPLPPDYSVKLESAALKNILDQLGLVRPLDLVAWSFGAEVTLNFALDNPARVRSLILIEPPAYWVLRAAGKLDAEAKKNEELLAGFKGDISENDLERFALAVGLVPPGKPAHDLPQWPVWVQHRRSLRNNPFVFKHNDELKRLAAFQPPVLLVKGQGSAKFLHQIIDILASKLPHSRIIEMPAGHAPHIVSMDRFIQEMDHFQTTLDRSYGTTVTEH
jgi:pimeloyl-ACP methyl ester carboxylesterase